MTKYMAALVTLGIVLATPCSAAHWKDRPPAGVSFLGTWQLDPYRSDDPKAVLDAAREDLEKKWTDARRAEGARMARHGGGFPGGRGGWHRGTGDKKPAADSGKHELALVKSVSRNSPRLTITAEDRKLKIVTDDDSVECAPGIDVAVSDALGDWQRKCGWDGAAWVVETHATQGKKFQRSDRYELSADKKTLTYVTVGSGERVPEVKISRTYTLTAPN